MESIVTRWKALTCALAAMILLLSVSVPALAEDFDLEGDLESGDATLEGSGEFYDEFEFDVAAGQGIEIDLESDDFDPYLILISPNEDVLQNDDWEEGKTDSRIEAVADVGGTWRVIVTSYQPGETGEYEGEVELIDADDMPATVNNGGGGQAVGEAVGDAIEFSGDLEQDDDTLEGTGEFYEEYEFEAVAGQGIVVDMRSTDFDPYLILISPSEETWQNDDWQDDRNRSRIEMVADETGTWRVLATSYRAGEVGDFTGEIQLLAAGGSSTGSSPAGTVAAVAGETTEFSGDLAQGDDTLPQSGEFYEEFEFEAVAGQEIVVDMRSTEFDPYVILISPSGLQWDNDDWQDDQTWSRLEVSADATGTWRVRATSYEAGEVGDFTGEIQLLAAGDSPAGTVIDAGGDATEFSGDLEGGDDVLPQSGEFFEEFEFDAVAGQFIIIDMRSTEFDPYLILISPSGEDFHNDDWSDSRTHSRLEVPADATGTWRVRATSYEAGEVGEFVGTIRLLAEDPTEGDDADASDLSGRLDATDATLEETGEFYEEVYFDAVAGQGIVVDMHSTEFDTYLILISPSGERWDNDDWQDDQTWSRIHITADATGRWRVLATSYEVGETGNYTGEIQLLTGASDVPAGNTGSTSSVSGDGDSFEFSGVLASGDDTLSGTGEFFEETRFDAAAGQVLLVEMRSTEFDPYLILISPSGETWQNDDWQDDRNLSRIQITADADGEWRILATSYQPGETGNYTGTVQLVADAATFADSSDESGDEQFAGVLDTGSATLEVTGEFYDVHTFQADAGQSLTIEMRSAAFNPYLIVRSPSGETWSNDDWEDSDSLSRVDVVADVSGMWHVLATTYKPGEQGAYQVDVRLSASGAMTYSGALGTGDGQLDSGEWRDSYTIDGREGEYLVIDLVSDEFDTYLILVSPDGEQWDNDDHQGDETRSQIAMELPVAGEYDVIVTTYRPGETGDYGLDIRRVSDSGPAATDDDQIIRDELTRDDSALDNGEFIDLHTIEGRPGETLRADLRSDDFDTYLIIRSPTGEQFDNDDFEGQQDRSVLEVTMTEAGSYVVGVTSYEAGETGEYELRIGRLSGTSIETPEEQSAARLEIGRPTGGSLDSSDVSLPTGQFYDMFTFDVAAGQSVKIDMSATDFDTYLRVELPTGELLENDDFESRRDLSRIELTVPQAGRMRVVATSYTPEATGDYKLIVTAVAGNSGTNNPNVAGRAVRGVFVGISDYGGRISSLHYTAEDAEVAQQALVETGMTHSRLLQDDDATRDAVVAAVHEVGGACEPGDLFVFFYSGHGGQVDVPMSRRVDGHDPNNLYEEDDPDNIEETVCFYDTEMVDNEFAEMLSVIDDGVTVLVVLDSCFSGGFSKDVICRPGYIGLFSSPEDVVSMVAGKFEAGGYLAHFFAAAVGDQLADSRPEDQAITALELCHYVAEQYREHVRDPDAKSGGADYVNISTSRDLGYQQLVTDRGGVSPYTILFAW